MRKNGLGVENGNEEHVEKGVGGSCARYDGIHAYRLRRQLGKGLQEGKQAAERRQV